MQLGLSLRSSKAKTLLKQPYTSLRTSVDYRIDSIFTELSELEYR